jgi:hypothetical protein
VAKHPPSAFTKKRPFPHIFHKLLKNRHLENDPTRREYDINDWKGDISGWENDIWR